MSIETSWYIPGRVVIQRYAGTITMPEAKAAIENARSYFDEAHDNCLHTIVDFTAVEHFDITLMGLKDLQAAKGNTGWSVVVTNSNTMISHLSKFLSAAAAQLLNVRMRMVNSLEEAEAFLSEMDNEVAAALRRAG